MTTENTPLANIPLDPHHAPAAKRPTSMFRMALPLVYAGMGVALGTLTGVGTAFVLVPEGPSVAASDSAPAMPMGTQSANSIVAKQTAENAQPPAIVRVAEHRGLSNADGASPRTHAMPSAAAKTTVGEGAPGRKQNPQGKAPAAAEKALGLPATPNVAQPRKHVAHPVAVQPRIVLASAPEVEDVQLDNEQLATADEAKSPTFYSEGDLTVADYNPNAGTIETSDGRTFVLGTTVRASSASTWDDYHSSVHYRCDQEGSCMLERAGAVAPNAKVI